MTTINLIDMNGIRILLFLLIPVVCFQHASAQSKGTVSGTFHGASFADFAAAMEQQGAYTFYYNDSDVVSLHVTLSFKQAHLRAVLDKILAGSSLFYAMDDQGHVFITQGYTLPISLPEGFFEGKWDSGAPSYLVDNHVHTHLPESRTKSDLVASVENKLYAVGPITNQIGHGTATVAGYVKDHGSGESIAGAIVSAEQASWQAVTDQFGFYSLKLPKGRHVLHIRALGMYDTKRQIILYSDGTLNVDMNQRVMALKEVVIASDKVRNVRSTEMGVARMDMATMKQIPSVLGEVDVLRAVMNLPGVQTVGEASTGLNVRGGSSDENLVLFNGATIFNPTHLFGFFSSFDPDLVKSVELYKASMPAAFGGRLSSVLDVQSLDGNTKNFSGSAGIGPLTTKITLQGPYIRNRSSFVVGYRTTYSNWILHAIPGTYSKSKANFSDLTVHLSHKFNDKNQLYLTGYASQDGFNLNNDTSYAYQNHNVIASWKHVFSNSLYLVTSAGYDGYAYQVKGYNNPVNSYIQKYDIGQFHLKADFSEYLNDKNTFHFGIGAIRYTIHPGFYDPLLKGSVVSPDTVEAEQAMESAAYLEDAVRISDRFSFSAGVRYSFYAYLGPKQVAQYTPGLPRTSTSIESIRNYRTGKVIDAYQKPEIRISGRYSLSDNMSVKAGFNTTSQFIHELSNTVTVSPTDIWTLSGPYIQPEFAKQVSAGLYHNFKENTIEASLEVYYKWMAHMLDFKSGAQLTMNHQIETQLIDSKGKAYGAELMIKKTAGKLNGWVSYTYSRSFIRSDDPLAGESINHGDFYPSNYDKPHDFTLIGNYKLSHRFSISLNVLYSTGRPITYPIAEFDYGGSTRVLYSDRNQYRIPDYFRMDASMNIEGNARIHQLTHNSWTIGVFNITGRKNPYSIYFISENGRIKGYKLSIFGSAIPFLTYNIRF